MHRLPGRWSVWRCTCATHTTAPMPTDPALYYPTEYYAYAAPPTPRRSPLLRWLYRRGYAPKLVGLSTRVLYGPGPTPAYRPHGRILDVGCGNGTWLMKMAALGWEVAGVEPGLQAAQAAQAAGLAVQHGTLETVDYAPGSFDVVRIWHVLEHVPQPLATLRQAYRLLKPGGQLIIGVPNIGGWLARLAGPFWFDLDVPRHVWHWTPQPLAVLVERAGLRIERLRHGYYGSYSALRSLMYWTERHDAADHSRRTRWQQRLIWLRRQKVLAPLHGLFGLLEWNNYIELTAVKPQ